MSRRFRRLEHGVDPAPFLAELDAHPDLWSLSAQRQSAVAVQRETESIMVFDHGTAETFREARERRPITYVGRPTPSAEALPETTAFVRALARRVHGLPGRAVLVSLRPRGHVYEHVDQGLYYHLRGRYHLVLKSVAGSPLRAGPETVRMREGELWWFDNRLPHDAVNESDEERIHLIMDVLSPGSVLALPIRILRSPRDSLRRLGRKLSRRRRRDAAPGQDTE